MRWLVLVTLVLLLSACFPKAEEGKGLWDVDKEQDKNQTRDLMQQAVPEYTEKPCSENQDCSVGRSCQDGFCVPN